MAAFAGNRMDMQGTAQREAQIHVPERDVGSVPFAPAAAANESHPLERAGYRPGGANRPVAAALSVAMVGLMIGGLLLANVVVPRMEQRHLEVVTINELHTQPPPPPPAPPQEKTPPTKPQVFAPPPPIRIATNAPSIPVADTPPPPVPTPISAPVSDKPAAPAPAVVAGPVDGGDISSNVLSAPPPSYPVDSRRQHEQGTVKLRVLLGFDGSVENLEIASSSGSYRLDRAAMNAVRHWRWKPMMRAGQAVRVSGIVPVVFALS